MQSDAPQHRRFQIPRDDRSAIIEPPLETIGDLVAANRGVFDQQDCDLHGRKLSEIVRMARAELLSSARQWSGAYGDLPAEPPDPRGSIFVAGHQPQMFHPGVWCKNFVLSKAAAQHGATAVNLLVDNDVVSEASIRVPGGTVLAPSVEPIPLDRPDPQIPYEERRIEDRAMFAEFGRRVIERIAPLVAEPLIAQYWPRVLRRAEHIHRLGACLSQARHQLETSWGVRTLEVPQSAVCSSESFQWLIAYILARLREFRTIHNEAVREYRRAHRIRSVSHPVPELIEDAPWQETPFWVWTDDNLHRRRLFARANGREIMLSDRQSWETNLPLHADGDAARAVEQLLHLQRHGVRIRSRALTTTLWARLVLSDLFIHGIGGAKYDEVTDRLIERFFGFLPPRFMVVSATVLLPIERQRATWDDARTLERQLRELTYHPEKFLDRPDTAATEAIAVKQRWIETVATRENAKQRCQAIREVNASLQPNVEPMRRQLLDRQSRLLKNLDAESVLASREYAFCLYPEQTLRNFFGSVALGEKGPR